MKLKDGSLKPLGVYAAHSFFSSLPPHHLIRRLKNLRMILLEIAITIFADGNHPVMRVAPYYPVVHRSVMHNRTA